MFVTKNSKFSSKQMQKSLTIATSFLALCLLAQCISGMDANNCTRKLTRHDRRTMCTDYLRSYDVEREHKIQDGIEAQLNYIYLADEEETGDNYDKLHKLFFPGKADRTLTDTITSLVKLNKLRDKAQEFGIEGQHSDAVILILDNVADNACQWLRNQNISVGNCTNNTLLHQLQHRLDFIKALEEAKEMMRNVPGADCPTPGFIDYCAWMHHTVLNRCEDPATNNTQLYESLNDICEDECHGLTLCPAATANI